MTTCPVCEVEYIEEYPGYVHPCLRESPFRNPCPVLPPITPEDHFTTLAGFLQIIIERLDRQNSNSDRIIQLLEGDKSFAGEVLERIFIEAGETNLMLNRIHCSIDPEAKAGWEKWKAERGPSTSAPFTPLHYPLMGDPPPPPPGVVTLNSERAGHHVETDYCDHMILLERNAYLDRENLRLEGRICELEKALQTFQLLYQQENQNG